MTGNSDFRRAIADARAFLEAMRSSDHARLLVRSGDTEFFVSRRAEPSPLSVPAVGQTPQAPHPPVAVHRLAAPHVATIVRLPAPGQAVTKGEQIATISVLDTEEALNSPVTGRVVDIACAAGSLVNFGEVLLTIEAEA